MKQLKQEQWLELFSDYDDYKKSLMSKNDFEIKYRAIRGVSFFDKKFIYSKRNFLEKYKRYNLGMTNLISQTGKSPKKGKGSGRPKKLKITPMDIVKKNEKKCQKNNWLKFWKFLKIHSIGITLMLIYLKSKKLLFQLEN
ncbi:hypothetical protein U5U50_01430 [Mycoplasma sp. 888]|uniref:hypothetical protein n=1 Tax=Mycoplasma sp. 888 TaxID=3108483 RepID=UPI002D773261|nr:hypothetical protein [Mycoplasma sp. 888]WRQ25728.1 hypothetical protein U5U50_02900 [Mycoplasma sp. 888]WRQ26043.1 hypothetical protein U5U50_01430 [Mycoplasma sp. 888]